MMNFVYVSRSIGEKFRAAEISTERQLGEEHEAICIHPP